MKKTLIALVLACGAFATPILAAPATTTKAAPTAKPAAAKAAPAPKALAGPKNVLGGGLVCGAQGALICMEYTQLLGQTKARLPSTEMYNQKKTTCVQDARRPAVTAGLAIPPGSNAARRNFVIQNKRLGPPAGKTSCYVVQGSSDPRFPDKAVIKLVF